jgi:hypothetical protein
VRGAMTLPFDPPRERGRQLRVNEKLHTGCNTA